MDATTRAQRVFELLAQAKAVAKEYYELTGRPLGITGEVGEYEAVRLLPNLELAAVRQDGHDALRRDQGATTRLQIKARCYAAGHKENGQRLGSIDLDKEWDALIMVLLDPDFEAREIWEADRAPVEVALTTPGSIARNERGALSVSKVRSIGRLIWKRGC